MPLKSSQRVTVTGPMRDNGICEVTTAKRSPCREGTLTNTVGHIGLAVQGIEKFLERFCLAFSLPIPEIRDVCSRRMKVALLNLKELQLEVLEDYSPDGAMARLVREKGNTIHHLCMTCDNVADTIMSLGEQGVAFIDDQPRIGLRGKPIAFISPDVFGGITVELSER